MFGFLSDDGTSTKINRLWRSRIAPYPSPLYYHTLNWLVALEAAETWGFTDELWRGTNAFRHWHLEKWRQHTKMIIVGAELELKFV